MRSEHSSDSIRNIGDLFVREPPQFGMRGDSYLWLELRERFAGTALPDSVWTLRKELEVAWETAVGQRLTDTSTPIYVPRFDPGHGMSAGHVVPQWWTNTGIMLLIDRYNGVARGE